MDILLSHQKNSHFGIKSRYIYGIKEILDTLFKKLCILLFQSLNVKLFKYVTFYFLPMLSTWLAKEFEKAKDTAYFFHYSTLFWIILDGVEFILLFFILTIVEFILFLGLNYPFYSQCWRLMKLSFSLKEKKSLLKGSESGSTLVKLFCIFWFAEGFAIICTELFIVIPNILVFLFFFIPGFVLKLCEYLIKVKFVESVIAKDSQSTFSVLYLPFQFVADFLLSVAFFFLRIIKKLFRLSILCFFHYTYYHLPIVKAFLKVFEDRPSPGRIKKIRVRKDQNKEHIHSKSSPNSPPPNIYLTSKQSLRKMTPTPVIRKMEKQSIFKKLFKINV